MAMRAWKLGRLLLLSTVMASCIDGDPFDIDGPRSCEVADQNEWLVGLMEEVYLWNDELPTLDPADYESPAELIRALRYEQDRWSRVSDKSTSDALFKKGMILGYGWRTKRDENGDVRLASVHANSSAGAAGLQRGDRILAINDVLVADLDEMELWSDVLGPHEPGVVIQVDVEDGDQAVRTVEVVKDWIEIVTVSTHEILEQEGRKIGYLVFETFVEPAEDALEEVFAEFHDQGVDAVVVDLRYNGGGLLAISQLFADLLAGIHADGQIMYGREFNDSLADQNSFKHFERRNHSVDANHIVFLTSRNTVSASELVINAVRPYVEVSVVGDNTGGKPFGMYSWEFCEQIAYPVTFRMVNAEGATDYFDGLTPDCLAGDDLDHALGDPQEASLREALAILAGRGCTTAPLQYRVARLTERLDGEPLHELLGGSW